MGNHLQFGTKMKMVGRSNGTGNPSPMQGLLHAYVDALWL